MGSPLELGSFATFAAAFVTLDIPLASVPRGAKGVSFLWVPTGTNVMLALGLQSTINAVNYMIPLSTASGAGASAGPGEIVPGATALKCILLAGLNAGAVPVLAQFWGDI